MKPNRKRRRIVGWSVLALALASVVFCASDPGDAFRLFVVMSGGVHDTTCPSPDGAYVAAARDIDTGAVGSGSRIMMRKRFTLFPLDGRGALAVGPYQFFGPLRWTGKRTLLVVYGSSGPPDPSWETRWRDVKIVYVRGMAN